MKSTSAVETTGQPAAGSSASAARRTVVPSSLLPHSTSSLQQALRANSRRTTAPAESEQQHSEVQQTKDEAGDALSWTRDRVEWKRGGTVLRTYSYRHEAQPVTQALFVDYRAAENDLSADDGTDPVASTSAVTLDSPAGTTDSPAFTSPFGPYRQRNPTAWSDDPLPLPTEPPASEKPTKTATERHLVVILSTVAFAYPASGGVVPIHLPFRVERAWALDHGMVLQAAATGGASTAGQAGDSTAGSTSLYTLSSPFDEFRPVAVRSEASLSTARAHGNATPSLLSEMAVSPCDPNERVVFSSSQRLGSPAVIVTSNHATGEVTLWQYNRLDAAVEEGTNLTFPALQPPRQTDAQDQLAYLSTVGALSPREISQQQESTFASSPMSRGPSSLSGTKRKHGVSFADPADASSLLRDERSIRRVSAQGSTLLGGDGGRRPRSSLPRNPLDQEEEMLDALAHNAEPHQSHILRSGHHVGPNAFLMQQQQQRRSQQGDRRASLTRNELSVTMDRMALSQSGIPFGLGGNGNGFVGAGADLAHEATILLGEEARATPTSSELVLTKVWSGNAGASVSGNLTAHLFDVRGPHAILALHVSQATLVLLRLTTDPETKRTAASYLREMPAAGCTIECSDRSPDQDLLVDRPDGTRIVLAADGLERSAAVERTSSQVSLTTGERQAGLGPAIMNDALDSRPRSTADLCLEALAKVLPFDSFVQLRDNVHTREGRGQEIAVVERFLSGNAPQAESAHAGSHASSSGAGSSPSNGRTTHGLTSLLRSSRRRASSAQSPAQHAAAAPPSGPLFEGALLALHLLAQRLLLEVGGRHMAREIGRIVANLATAAGFVGWVDFYARKYGLRAVTNMTFVAAPAQIPASPPCLLAHLRAALSGQTSTSFPDIQSVGVSVDLAACDYYGPRSDPTQLSSRVTALYRLLASPAADPVPMRARRAVLKMAVEYTWTQDDLDKLAPHVYLPLREALRSCQIDPPSDWPPCAYNLISRLDMARQRGQAPDYEAKERTAPEHFTAVSIRRLSRSKRSLRITDERTTSVKSRSATRFNEDRRLEEVARMLRFDTPCVISSGDRSLEQLTPQIQQSVLIALSQRTMALPVGAGMYYYRSKHVSADIDEVKILHINTAARILPMSSPVALADKDVRDPPAPNTPDRMEWPDFHAGVAAALQTSFPDEVLDSSTLSFNRPASLDGRHAGLLFGLGLTGHLSSMLSSQAYEYLKAKHDPTSVAILLGLAVSFLGTGDSTVTSIISIHLPALHPPNSSMLNVSGMTQAAAATSLGLLHFASGHRTFADVLLSELCNVRVSSLEDGTLCREAYALSAGFGFGMIMLGRGRDRSVLAAHEVNHLRIFRSLILGESNHPLPGSHQSGAAIDINITSPAATIALTLMYLRSERQDVADLLPLPDTLRALDYIRPDLLLLRVACRGLVLWSQIEPTKTWVEGHLPSFLISTAPPNASVTSDTEVARWHIISGACFAIGLRHAGTASAEAHATLIHYLDRLSRASYSKTVSVQNRIRRHALRNCLAVVSLSIALVMAGTGEVNVLRRLRVAHGLYSEGVTYGSHLATHMALGLLFLGGGKFTLGNSDAAIAGLLISLYPALPAISIENRAHLQAYRHLWVLAVEPRYLEARDVDTNDLVFLPVRLRLKDDSAAAASSKAEVGGSARTKQLVAPTLMPDARTIEAIQIDSPRYLPFVLKLTPDSAERTRFLRSGTLYVKRRTGHLTYAEDPRGVRSIFTRSKSEAGSSVFDFGELSSLLSTSSSGLREFVAAFSGEAEALAATNALCHPQDLSRPPTPFEAFASTVLLECLTKDKFDLAGTYHAVFASVRNLERSGAGQTDPVHLDCEELEFLVDFYRAGHFKRLLSRTSASSSSQNSGSSSAASSREALLSPAFITHVSMAIDQAGADAIATASASWALPAYLRDGTWPVDASTAANLSRALRALSLPDLLALQTLRNLVASARATDYLPLEAVEVLLRKVRSTLTTQGGQAEPWKSEASAILARAWCS